MKANATVALYREALNLLRRWMEATEGSDPTLRLLWEETEEFLDRSGKPVSGGLDAIRKLRQRYVNEVIDRLSNPRQHDFQSDWAVRAFLDAFDEALQ